MSNWIQKNIILVPHRRGYHLITSDILKAIPELERIKIGLLNIFIQHTSASISINENTDPKVSHDLEVAFSKLAPETDTYHHDSEGADDMPAHIKTSLLGCSLNIPINNGKLTLGTWQGIYLCEHRNSAPGRKLVLTIQGDPR